MVKGNVKNNLFVMQGSTITSSAATTAEFKTETTRIWHMHLGHMSKKGLANLSN